MMPCKYRWSRELRRDSIWRPAVQAFDKCEGPRQDISITSPFSLVIYSDITQNTVLVTTRLSAVTRAEEISYAGRLATTSRVRIVPIMNGASIRPRGYRMPACILPVCLLKFTFELDPCYTTHRPMGDNSIPVFIGGGDTMLNSCF